MKKLRETEEVMNAILALDPVERMIFDILIGKEVSTTTQTIQYLLIAHIWSAITLPPDKLISPPIRIPIVQDKEIIQKIRGELESARKNKLTPVKEARLMYRLISENKLARVPSFYIIESALKNMEKMGLLNFIEPKSNSSKSNGTYFIPFEIRRIFFNNFLGAKSIKGA